VSDFNWLPAATAAQREDAEKEIKPLTVESISDHGWQALATIQYYGYLRKASIHLSRFGEIQFEGENSVTKLLSINIEVFDDGIRRLRSLEWLGNHVAEMTIAQDEGQLKAHPNAAAALKDLPSQFIQLGRRKEAIAAEKNWVAYLLSQTKHDDDWSKNIASAYQVLAWQQLLSLDFDGALASSDEAITFDHRQLAGEEYRGFALLFLGRTQEAEALFLGNGGKKMDPTATMIWDDAVVSDLATLRKVGITGAGADRIGNLVTRQQDQRNMDQDEQTLKANPDDEKALRQLPYLYSKAHRWEDAVAGEKRAANFFRSKPDSDSTKLTSLLDTLSYLAWYQLFARDFAGSLATTDEARRLDPDYLDTEEDRAYALMFLGRNREAEEIYFGNIGRGMSTNANLLWEASVVADLTSLENQGVTNRELTRVRGLLQRPENERLLGQYLQDWKKNPNDPSALRSLPGVYYNLQRWKEAADAQKNYVVYLQRQTKRDADWSKSLVTANGSLSWYQLLSGDFAGALASSGEAINLDSGDMVATMNHAHALLFLGRAKEAETIYVANIGKKLSSNQEWDEVVLDDFNSLEKEGITSPEIPRLRTLMTQARYERQLAEYARKLKANPNDEDALSGISDVYRHLGRAQEAVGASKAYVEFIQRQPNHNANWTTTLSGAYVGLAFHQLFIRDFAGALASSDEALKLRPKYLIAETNRAHALLFLGRIKKAEAIYLQHRGEKVSANSDQTWDEAILTDFDDLEGAGITHPDFARLRKLLQPRPK
jgi:tetratricopeptide (TPR) repeat protein